MEEERHWQSISIGDEVSLQSIELLKNTKVEEGAGLRGKMVSSRRGFSGPARLLDSSQDSQVANNEIIITQYLTPELVGLFPKSAGCLADVGGALSHAAIVGRELDYPILVLAGCSSTIKDGDWLEVSAEGIITVSRGLEKKAATKN